MRILVCVDVQNLFYVFQKDGYKIDFGKLKKKIMEEQINNNEYQFNAYFSALKTDIAKRFKAMLEYNGYWTNVKETFEGDKDIDVRIVTDILGRVLNGEKFDKLVLVSGDGDYSDMIRILKDRGKKVVVYALKELFSSKLKVADEIRFIEKEEILFEEEEDNPLTHEENVCSE